MNGNGNGKEIIYILVIALIVGLNLVGILAICYERYEIEKLVELFSW